MLTKEERAANKAAYMKTYREENKEKLLAQQSEYYENNKEEISVKRKEYRKGYEPTPKGRFQQHKDNTKKRGLEFLLTFKEWWSLWEPHWHQRGGLGHEMCMCRTNDTGPYAVGNVRIDTMANNVKEARILEEANR
mgnify:CR=1 FL=1|tara:strand:+ start:48 stop:455 length:408 start_codon:yes stop_codon:yes gene_type:complete